MDNSQGIRLDLCRKPDVSHPDISNPLSQAVYRSLLHLSWIDKLVDNVKVLFVDLYGNQLKKPNSSGVECHFDEYFDQQIRELEKTVTNKDAKIADSPARTNDELPSVSDEYEEDKPPPLPGVLLQGLFVHVYNYIVTEMIHRSS